MARALSTQEDNAWTTGTQSAHVRVVVNDGVIDRELNDLEGRDWIKSLKYSHSIDSTLQTANLICHLREGEYNLSPLDGGSPINATTTLLAIGNTITIYTATMPRSTAPASGDWNEIFDGVIEEIEIQGGDTIAIRCLEKGAALRSLFLETVTEYPSSGGSGTKFTEVVQDIIDDHGDSTVLYILDDAGNLGTVASPPAGEPAAIVTSTPFPRRPVLDTIKDLVDQIGWDLKYRWDSGTGAFQLTMIEPDRDQTSIDWTFTQSEWTSIALRFSRDDVRNYVRVIYFDSDLGGERAVKDDSDPTSITKYGRRYMEHAEEKGSQIDTSTEALTLATSILTDLKEPTAYANVVVPYLHGVELRDLVRLTADNIHFDANQDLAVTGIRHSIMQGQRGTTSLQLAGQPAAGIKHWREKQAKYTQRRVASSNFGFSVGQRGNVAPNPFFDESDN